ncbi:hypothetical protein B0A79_20930, partial [Flavobacterium piscis]
IQDEFVLKLLSNDKLTIDSYTVFAKRFSQEFTFKEDFDYNLINKNKVEKLIEFNFISLTESNFEAVKAIHPGLQINLLIKDWSNYLAFTKNHELDIEDIILVLKDPNLKEELKVYIIKNQIYEEDLINKELAFEVSTFLLDIKDISKTNSSILSFSKLETIMNHKFENNIKVRLINLMANKLTKIEILNLKKLMQKPYNNIHSKSQIMLEDNEVNWEFIKVLQDKKIAGEAKSNKKNEIRVWLNNFVE